MKGWMIAVLLSVVLLLMSSSSVAAYDIVGDYVVEDTAKAIIYTWPHTMTYSEQDVWTCVTSKIYEGGVDVAWGFDTDSAVPTGAWYNGNPVSKNKFTRVDRDYLGSDRWYLLENFTVEQGEEYCMKVSVKIKEPGSGKYNFCIKPTDLTVQEAVADNKMICLDPWWNVSYMYRNRIYGNVSANSANVTVITYVNLTINNSLEMMHCPLRVGTTNGTMSFVYWNNYDDYVCVNYTDTDDEVTIIDTGNGTQNKNLPGNVLMWMDLGDCSGTDCPDKSIYDQTATKTAAGNPANTTGKIDGGQSWSGVQHEGIIVTDSDSIDIGDSESFTAMMWIKPDSPTEAYSAIFEKPGSFFVFLGSSEQINGEICNSSTTKATFTTANSVITYGNWYHVAFTYDSATGAPALYLNGEDATSSTGSGSCTRNLGNNLNIGFNAAPGTIALKGPGDAIRFYNDSLSADQIRAIYYAESGQFFVSANESNPNVTAINIVSPENTSYTHNSSIPLTWQFSSGQGYTCVSSYYSLNGGPNTTTLCLNLSSITPAYGANTLTMWVTDSNGTLHTDTVSFTNLFANYDSVCVYDEMTESEINGSGMLFQVYCPDTTLNYSLTDHCYTGINFTCSFEELRLTGTWGSSTIWRTLIPEFYTGNISFYMYNATAEDSVEVNLFIQDLTGEYAGGIIHLSKVLSDGSTPMVDQVIDAESKVVIFYINGEKYHITIEDADGIVRDLGDLTADDSTSKTITVSDIALVPERTLNGLGWLFGGTIDELNLTFRDTRGITVITTYTVYNASNVSLPVLYTDTCIDEECFFNYTTPNNTTEYKACFEALTTQGYTYNACEIYSSRTWQVAYFESNPILYAIVASLVAMLIIAGSSAIHVKYGLIGASLWMIFVNTRGWFSALTLDSTVLYGVFAFALAVSVLYAILEGERPS